MLIPGRRVKWASLVEKDDGKIVWFAGKLIKVVGNKAVVDDLSGRPPRVISLHRLFEV